MDQERRSTDPKLLELAEGLQHLKDKYACVEKKLDANIEVTTRIDQNTAAIVEAWQALSGGLKVLGWLGTVARYVAYFAGAVSAIGGAYYAITHWGQPPVDIQPPE